MYGGILAYGYFDCYPKHRSLLEMWGAFFCPVGALNFRFHRPATPVAPWSTLRQGWRRFGLLSVVFSIELFANSSLLISNREYRVIS